MIRPIFLILNALCILAILLLAGCAGEAAHRSGKRLLAEGHIDEGLAKLDEATQAAPNNLEYKATYVNSKDIAVNRLLSLGLKEQSLGNTDEAERIYRQVIKLDSRNLRAQETLARLDRDRRHAKLLKDAKTSLASGDLAAADTKVALVLLEAPEHADARLVKRQIEELAGRNQVVSATLRDTFRKPVSLEFRDANFKIVMEALTRHTGLNFVLDKDVPANLTTTVFLRNVSVEEALDVILTTHQLDKRVLNDTTLLIFQNTAAKQAEHQDLVVKSFYLSNVNAKQVMEMLKTVIKAKNLYVDEKLNLLIMRDTPTGIRLAERLVALQDIPDAEVMLEVEVMEIQRSRLQELGIKFPTQLTLAPLATGTTLTLEDLRTGNSSRVGATISNTVINARADVSDANVLANPRIRTRNREKAEIKIGDRVPVISTTTTATGFVSESTQYVDVGLKLNVEPTVYPDNEIAIRLALEVSSVVKEVTSKAGSLAYQIGSRNATTVLRLRDGETQILGGLINDQERISANRVPGLGDLPLLGRLFSSQKDDNQKTELVLSITPRLIRSVAPPPHVPTEFWSGTENNLRLKPLTSTRQIQPPPKQNSAAAPVQSVSGALPSLMADAPPQNQASTVSAVPAPPRPNVSAPAAPEDAADPPPTMRWEGPAQAKVGESFKLLLKISSTTPINGFPVQVKYDPTVLELIDATAGGFLALGKGKIDFAKRLVGTAGLAFITQTAAGGSGAKGDGDLVELQFRALKSSSGALVTALPTVAQGANGRALRQSGPALIQVGVTN